MYDSLLRFYNCHSTIPLTSHEFELVQQTFIPRRLKRKEFFLQEGDVCKYFGFVVKGALRQYIVGDNGEEYTVELAIENSWIGDWESFVTSAPSKYNIDACEDAELLVTTRAKNTELREKCPSINRASSQVIINHYIASRNRQAASNSLSAEKRYADFAKQHADLLQRFPWDIIASYLGITNRQNQVQQKLLEEKDLFMKEIHHRVKNDLNIIISLLESQSLYLSDTAARVALQDTQNRVHAVFLLHQKLYGSAAVSEVNVSTYVLELVNYLYETFDIRSRNVVITHKIEPIYLDSREVLPLAIILNEAITNALKYAFPNGRHGEIRLLLQRMASGMVQMQIRDNGVGLPAGYRPAIGQSLGFTLITGLANQLGGYCGIEEEEGVVITIRFMPGIA